MKEHKFVGKWISDSVFAPREPRNVFHRQLQKISLPLDEHSDSHILFRKKFMLKKAPENAKVYITADDFYKLYINGKYIAQGPAPAYHNCYNYNEIDVTEYLTDGENTVAVHTYYQGLINRVWQSGDQRHGLIMDLEVDGRTVVCSDESFKTIPHDGFREVGTAGYATQFLEEYDSRAAQVGFEQPDHDDSGWSWAKRSRVSDHTLMPQESAMLVFETIKPVDTQQRENTLFLDLSTS